METIVSPTQRVHVVDHRSQTGRWITTKCGQDFPARTCWPADGMAITCKRCARWADAPGAMTGV